MRRKFFKALSIKSHIKLYSTYKRISKSTEFIVSGHCNRRPRSVDAARQLAKHSAWIGLFSLSVSHPFQIRSNTCNAMKVK